MKDDSKNIIYQDTTNSVDENGVVTGSKSRTLKKVPRTPDFIMLFTKHVTFLEHLNNAETNIMYEIFSKYVGVGNLINMSPAIKKTITKRLGIDPSYINRALRGLLKKGVIIEDENGLQYLSPHLFGKGNWEDIHQLRHEVSYDFDFNRNEMVETRKIATQYGDDIEGIPHEVIDTKEYKDEDGTHHQEITIAESDQNIHKNQASLTFDNVSLTKQEKSNDVSSTKQDDSLEIMKEKNKSKELAIEEMKLKLEMKKEGLM